MTRTRRELWIFEVSEQIQLMYWESLVCSKIQIVSIRQNRYSIPNSFEGIRRRVRGHDF